MGMLDKIKNKLLKESETNDVPLNPVPLEKRESWVGPAVVYAGVEFSFAVVMAGAGLASGLSIKGIILATIVGLVVFIWLGDAINAYIGAKTGLPGAVIARQSFGSLQARIIASLVMVLLHTGWWAINTALVANAFCTAFGIDYNTDFVVWAIMVISMGIVFIIPALLGYLSMKWMDYIAVPIGLLIFGMGIYLSIKVNGLAGIINWAPKQSMPWSVAVSTVIGTSVCQWAMIADYSRMHRPTWKNAALMPSLLIVVGFVEIILGAIMAVGIGTYDIVQVMASLGYPFWAYLLLFVAQWTSQIVAVYSAGLSLGNMFNANNARTQKILTLFIGILGIALALAGILNRFMDWLLALGVVFSPLAGIMTADFFLLRKEKWEDIGGWNIVATFALMVGVIIGYYNQYKYPIGIPPLQAYILTGLIYYITMRIQARLAPNKFTSRDWGNITKGDSI